MSIKNTSAIEFGKTQPVQVVEASLGASMIPDPVRARSYLASEVNITFTGPTLQLQYGTIALNNRLPSQAP